MLDTCRSQNVAIVSVSSWQANKREPAIDVRRTAADPLRRNRGCDLFFFRSLVRCSADSFVWSFCAWVVVLLLATRTQQLGQGPSLWSLPLVFGGSVVPSPRPKHGPKRRPWPQAPGHGSGCPSMATSLWPLAFWPLATWLAP